MRNVKETLRPGLEKIAVFFPSLFYFRTFLSWISPIRCGVFLMFPPANTDSPPGSPARLTPLFGRVPISPSGQTKPKKRVSRSSSVDLSLGEG